MADALIPVVTIKDQYTLVASEVRAVRLWRMNSSATYLFTFVESNAAAPTDSSLGVPIFRDKEPDFEDLEFDKHVNVYVYTQVQNGKIIAHAGSGQNAASGLSGTIKVPADNFFIQENGIATALTNPTVIDDKQITVDNPATFSIGDVVIITNPAAIYFGEILAVVGPVITLDSLLPFAYSAGNTVQSYTKDMNVDGSVTPQTFSIFGPGVAGIKLNIVRLIFNALTASSVDLSTFGDIAGGLINGLLLRGVPNPSSGLPPSNQFNIKTNGDLDTLTGGDWIPYAATNPIQGQDGFTARYTFGGKDKHDTILPLEVGDRLDMIISDNLLTLTIFRILFGANTEFL